MKYIECPDMTSNRFVSFYSNINGNTYRLSFRWNNYCNCCILNVYDSDGEMVNGGNFLVNRTVIGNDLRALPEIEIRHKEDLNLEPTPETMKDYVLIYEDTTE